MESENKFDNKVILVDKPLDWTSAKVINKLKKALFRFFITVIPILQDLSDLWRYSFSHK